LTWKSAARPHKKRSREFFTTIGAIVFLLSIIMAFFKEFLLIGTVWAVAFLSYVLAKTEPETVEHSLTSRGVKTEKNKYRWGELMRFWFEEKWGQTILYIDTFRAFPGRLMMLLGDVPREKAKEILVEAMRHGATDYVAEYTVSVVKLADEEIKGRIIGKEGRNIRTFELLTGVDVDLDEVKEIRISCFDPVRREIARVSLERLITDGRIQPAKIEEIVSKTKNDIERLVHEAGQKLSHDVGVFDLPLEIIDLLGRFRYRFSYGQNMIAHTLEETKIGIKLASEVGADVDVVRRACLLHDIGKVITEDEGTHVQLGADLLRRFKFPEKVINAVYEHHEDKPFSSVESVLVYIADAISGARPGARVEDIEAYVKRMKSLEEVALTFKGVKSVFALSAGREVRVVVEPLEVDDASLVKLAHDIAGKIEKEQTYPGQVKVTVVREVRAFGIAK